MVILCIGFRDRHQCTVRSLEVLHNGSPVGEVCGIARNALRIRDNSLRQGEVCDRGCSVILRQFYGERERYGIRAGQLVGQCRSEINIHKRACIAHIDRAVAAQTEGTARDHGRRSGFIGHRIGRSIE